MTVTGRQGGSIDHPIVERAIFSIGALEVKDAGINHLFKFGLVGAYDKN